MSMLTYMSKHTPDARPNTDLTGIFAEFARRPIDSARSLLNGIGADALHHRPSDQDTSSNEGNSIAWLVWHAARQQDSQVAELSGAEQVWRASDWARRLGVERDEEQIGFGDSDADVAALRIADPELLGDYLEAVVEATCRYVADLTPAQLAEIVDEDYDPPVTRLARLVSVVDDAVAHIAQAQYVRGLVEDWSLDA